MALVETKSDFDCVYFSSEMRMPQKAAIDEEQRHQQQADGNREFRPVWPPFCIATATSTASRPKSVVNLMMGS